MKLSKKWLMVLALVLSLTMATAGTLAYLTDRDTVENTFTLGNVDIEIEEEFDQDSPLNPGVEVEKQAGITNVHKTSDAWVWMTVSVPAELDSYIELGWAANADATRLDTPVHDGCVSYLVKHPTELAPGDTTPMYLESVTLSDKVDFQNGEYVVVDGGKIVATIGDLSDVTVIVDGFAMQTEEVDNVNDAYTYYTTQWSGLTGGESGAEGGPAVVVDTAEELQSALEQSNNIDVAGNISAESFTVSEGADIDMELQNNTVEGEIDNYGDLVIGNGVLQSNTASIDNYGEAIIENVEMNAGSPSDYALINRAGSTATYDNVNLDSAGGGIAAADGAEVTFKGGSVAVNSTSTSGRYNFYAVGEGTVITIEDGTFSFSSTLNQKRAYIYAGAGTTVYVKGGTFGPASTRSGYTAGILGEGTVIITGGTFGFDPSAWVADGYEAVNNSGTWTVVAK